MTLGMDDAGFSGFSSELVGKSVVKTQVWLLIRANANQCKGQGSVEDGFRLNVDLRSALAFVVQVSRFLSANLYLIGGSQGVIQKLATLNCLGINDAAPTNSSKYNHRNSVDLCLYACGRMCTPYSYVAWGNDTSVDVVVAKTLHYSSHVLTKPLQQKPLAGAALVSQEPANSSFGQKLASLIIRGPKDQINMMISHAGAKAQRKADTRNHILSEPYVSLAFGGPNQECRRLGQVRWLVAAAHIPE